MRLDGDDAFGAGGVGEERGAGDEVADGVDGGLGGAAVGVGLDEAAVEFDAGGLEADVVGHGLAADGEQEVAGGDGGGFAAGGGFEAGADAVGRAFELGELGGGVHVDAAAFEGFFEFAADVERLRPGRGGP
jgi:hypothetical protein